MASGFRLGSTQLGGWERGKTVSGWRTGHAALTGAGRHDMTGVGTAFFFLYVACAVTILSLLAAILTRDRHRDRTNGVAGVSSLETLPWGAWTPSKGWPPMTCWPGCRDLHRHDWGRLYLARTCWPGCADLHREDWWKAYVDRAEGIGAHSGVAPLSAAGQRPGHRLWAGRPGLLSRTAGRDRAAI